MLIRQLTLRQLVTRIQQEGSDAKLPFIAALSW